MDYKKIYDSICYRAKIETQKRIQKRKEGYYLRRSSYIAKVHRRIGWANNPNHPNIVLLTAREHFLCHWLLYEMNADDYRLAKAFYLMCKMKSHGRSNQRLNRYVPSSRIIEYAKKVSSELHSAYMKNVFWSEDMKKHMSQKHTGKNNHMYGKTHTQEAVDKIKDRWTQDRLSKAKDENEWR